MSIETSGETSGVSRRTFVVGAAVAVGCLACGGATAMAASESTFDAGEIKSFAEGFNDGFLKSHKVVIVRKGDTVYAESGVCTHKACTLKVVDATLRCPCHGSRFDLDGAPTKGPAHDPLPRYAVEVKGGRLFVDTNAIILPGEFDKPNASAKVS